MTSTRIEHLTEDEFADCFVGVAPPASVRVHLATCAKCNSEIGNFAVVMEAFSASAMSWSRAQPAMDTTVIARLKSRAFSSLTFRWAVPLAAAFILAVPAVHYEISNRTGATPSSPLDVGDSAGQIAQDNQMLQAVNVALAGDEPSPLRMYDLQEGPSEKSHVQKGLRNE